MDKTQGILRRAAVSIDRSRLSPTRVGSHLIERHLDKRETRAGSDDEWSTIEARRTTKHGTKVLVGDGLELTDLYRQHEIADKITPDPWWLPGAYVLKDAKLTTLARRVTSARQRVQRGWADEDTWDLGTTLARRTGEMLLHLADNTHGWPSGDTYPTFEDWQKVLRHHGSILVEHAENSKETQAIVDKLHEITTQGASQEERGLVLQELLDAEQRDADKVKASLTWVAENHTSLWD